MWRADAGRHRQADAADRAEQAAEDIGDEPGELDIDAAPKRGDPVAADGVDAQTGFRPAHRNPYGGQGDNQQNQRIGQPVGDQRAGAEIEEFRRGAAARLLEDQQRDAAPDEAGRQCDDDVGHARDDDEEPVDRADRRAGAQDRHSKQKRLAEARVFHRACREHVCDRHDRADREIDSAGDDDHRLRRGGAGQRQCGHRDRLRIERIEGRMDRHGGRQEDDQQRRHAEQRRIARRRRY